MDFHLHLNSKTQSESLERSIMMKIQNGFLESSLIKIPGIMVFFISERV